MCAISAGPLSSALQWLDGDAAPAYDPARRAVGCASICSPRGSGIAHREKRRSDPTPWRYRRKAEHFLKHRRSSASVCCRPSNPLAPTRPGRDAATRTARRHPDAAGDVDQDVRASASPAHSRARSTGRLLWPRSSRFQRAGALLLRCGATGLSILLRRWRRFGASRGYPFSRARADQGLARDRAL